ncbi:hypothetical protein [Actinocorallia aurea]
MRHRPAPCPAVGCWTRRWWNPAGRAAYSRWAVVVVLCFVTLYRYDLLVF